MSEFTRDRLERLREVLRAERWAVARLHALTADAARDLVARADADHWNSITASLFRGRIDEIAVELTAARSAFADAMEGIDRALLLLADAVVLSREPEAAVR